MAVHAPTVGQLMESERLHDKHFGVALQPTCMLERRHKKPVRHSCESILEKTASGLDYVDTKHRAMAYESVMQSLLHMAQEVYIRRQKRQDILFR